MLASLLLGAMTLSMVGCEDTSLESAQFPEKITATVKAGDTYEFTISPNTNWTLKIPLEVATYFKFIVGESERYTLNGKAGTHTITVGVSNIEEFDVVRVCEISMTMNGETRVIAEITRGGNERTFALYIAEFDTAEETFKTDTDGKWIYSTTPAERIDWAWSQEQWMQRVVVESNFDWFLSPEAPAWLLMNQTSGEAGLTELFLRVNREQLPLEDVECNIEFGQIYITNSTESNFEAIGSYPTEMEGCGNYCEVNLPEQMQFNADGDYYVASSESYVTSANGRIWAPRGAELAMLSKNADGTYSTEAKWMRIKMDDFPEEAGEIGAWERSFTLDVAVNSNTEPREGAIAALPKNVVDSNNYNPEDYIVSHITQDGWVEVVEVEAIYANSEETMAAFNSKFEKLKNGSWPWMGTWSDVPYGYKLTYNSNASGDDLIFDQPFARYEIYGFDGDGKAPYDPETCWLTIEPSDEYKELENGYIIRSRLGETIDGVTYTNSMAGSYGENEATIIFYDADDEPYALIYFILDPNYYTPTERPTGTISFADESYAELGATLAVIEDGDEEFSDELAYSGALQYRLTLNPNCTEATLLVPDFTLAYPYAEWLLASGGSGRLSVTVDTALLPATEEGVTKHSNHITLHDSSYSVVVNLVVVYNLQ